MGDGQRLDQGAVAGPDLRRQHKAVPRIDGHVLGEGAAALQADELPLRAAGRVPGQARRARPAAGQRESRGQHAVEARIDALAAGHHAAAELVAEYQPGQLLHQRCQMQVGSADAAGLHL